MKNAHKEDMEKNQRSQLSGLNSDIDELRLQYEYVLIPTGTCAGLVQGGCFIQISVELV